MLVPEKLTAQVVLELVGFGVVRGTGISMPTSSVSIGGLLVAILKITSKIRGCEGAQEN